ncbi:MAG: replication initiation protein, partial [Hyphomicrobium sp.]
MSGDGQALVRASKKTDEIAVVARHNNLIEAHYYASPQEQRMFLWAVHQAQEVSEGSQILRVSIGELAEFVGIEKNANIYAQMMDVTDRMTRRQVRIRNIESGEYVQANLLNARYRAGQGYVEVELSQFVLPYILQLKKNFTTVEMKYVMRLGSGHAMRIYDLVKSRSYRGHKVAVEIDELQSLLGTADKYKRFNNFRMRVLDVACEEINKRTDLTISFVVEPDKADKRKAGKVVFSVSGGAGKEEVPYIPGTPADTFVTKLTRVGLKPKDAIELVDAYANTDPDRITWHLEELERQYPKGAIKSPAAWLKAAIRDDYRPQRSLFEVEQDKKVKLAAEQRIKTNRQAHGARAVEAKEEAARLQAAE